MTSIGTNENVIRNITPRDSIFLTPSPSTSIPFGVLKDFNFAHFRCCSKTYDLVALPIQLQPGLPRCRHIQRDVVYVSVVLLLTLSAGAPLRDEDSDDTLVSILLLRMTNKSSRTDIHLQRILLNVPTNQNLETVLETKQKMGICIYENMFWSKKNSPNNYSNAFSNGTINRVIM